MASSSSRVVPCHDTGNTGQQDDDTGQPCGMFMKDCAKIDLQTGGDKVLKYFAEETGGRAIFNANRLETDLEKISGDLGNYYSLGFLGTDGSIFFVNVMTVDFFLFTAAFAYILGDDMRRRNMPMSPLFWFYVLVPVLGATTYLAMRPALSPVARD